MGGAQSRQTRLQRPTNQRGWRALRRAAYDEHTNIQQQLANTQLQLAATQQQLVGTQQQLVAAQEALTIAEGQIPECPICLESLHSDVHCATYACGHVYCGVCATNNPNCPQCQDNVVAWGGIQTPQMRLFYS